MVKGFDFDRFGIDLTTIAYDIGRRQGSLGVKPDFMPTMPSAPLEKSEIFEDDLRKDNKPKYDSLMIPNDTSPYTTYEKNLEEIVKNKNYNLEFSLPKPPKLTPELERIGNEADDFKKGYIDGLIGEFMPWHGIAVLEWTSAGLALMRKKGIDAYKLGLDLKPELSEKKIEGIEATLQKYFKDVDITNIATIPYQLGIVVRVARDYGVVLKKSQVPENAEQIQRFREGLLSGNEEIKMLSHVEKNYDFEKIRTKLEGHYEGIFSQTTHLKKLEKDRVTPNAVTGEIKEGIPLHVRQRLIELSDQFFPEKKEPLNISSYRPQTPDDFYRLGEAIRLQPQRIGATTPLQYLK